ncbi:MAG TPA: DUF1080 domain-containing protein [Lunatimonas sp.]|nr:DUF1080 domain-containing protein [Lunatimonas sp.]
MKSKALVYIPIILIYMMACSSSEPREGETADIPAESDEKALNALTTAEKDEGWELLFDGESTQGWHNYLEEGITGWKVEGGILYTEGGNGDIVTDREFENFELKVDWKIEEQGNSGVFYYVREAPEYPRIHHTGPEFQIIDDDNYPQKLMDNQKTGSISDVKAPIEITPKVPGVWNHTRILAKNGHVEHWFNGEKVAEAEMDSPEWKDMVSNSKFADFDYAQIQRGHIGLQDHGDRVAFKNIKIKVL